MAIDHCVWDLNVNHLNLRHLHDDHYSAGTPSSSSTRSSSMTSAFNFVENGASASSSPLMASRDNYMDTQAKARLPDMLQSFILYRCTLNEHCSEMDFDHTALEALSRMPFLQALQTVEHFSASVSSRIQKKSAYLMGILRGQEAHWDKFLVANGLGVSGNGNSEALSSPKGRQILNMPPQVLHFIGDCCLRGNCLPSDFTPEVCLSLHNLTVPLATKAVSAFNTNKRIIAGPKGGVINRPRFFLRLIQNVSEQSSTSTPTGANLVKMHSADGCSTRSSDVRSVGSESNADSTLNTLCAQLSDNAVISHHNSPKSNSELNLEQLAEIDFSFEHTTNISPSSNHHYRSEERIRALEEQIAIRQQREEVLMLELSEARQRMRFLQTECMRMRSMLGYN